MSRLPPNAAADHQGERTAAQPSRGFTAMQFRCPRCGSTRWGTVDIFGHCHGEIVWQFDNDTAEWRQVPEATVGYVMRERCPFEWVRSDDWTVFRPNGSAEPFPTRDAFERFVAGKMLPS